MAEQSVSNKKNKTGKKTASPIAKALSNVPVDTLKAYFILPQYKNVKS
jgi:hypothetical protein